MKEQEEIKKGQDPEEEIEVVVEGSEATNAEKECSESISEESDTESENQDSDSEEVKETPDTESAEEEENHEPTTEELLAKSEKELAEMKDKYLRQVAEFENYRKRTLKEKTDLILNGGEKVLTSLLPVLDDFSRALDNIDKSEDIEALKEGVKLISDKLFNCLAGHGLQKIETEGQDFNTDFHEAIAMIPAQNDEEKGKVLDCVQTGYKLNEKVIRHAKVAVGQ